jgi:hypothetical protein
MGFGNSGVAASSSATTVLVTPYYFFSVGEKELTLH